MGLDIDIKHSLTKKRKRIQTNNHNNEKDVDNDVEENISDCEGESDEELSFTDNSDDVDYEGFHTSYMGYHYMKIDLIEATIKYLENNKTSRSDVCLARIKSWLKKTSNLNNEENVDSNSTNLFVGFYTSPVFKLNFDKITEDRDNPNVLRENDLLGLLLLILHEDCDGYFSRGEVVDIYDLLIKISPYHKPEDKEYYDGFMTFAKQCVDNNRGMAFC